jgi:peroxiredoxin
MNPSRQDRINDLEGRFSQLESRLADSPEKEAISILHAIINELRREVNQRGGNTVGLEEPSLDYVANLYKSAPGMQGDAENVGLAVGNPAPDFTLPDADGEFISLSDFRGKNVVLVFYPLDWSPACSDQLSLYQAELGEFEKLGAVVIGVSVDSLYSHGAWAAVRGITFPLLADFNPRGEVARCYGVIRTSDGFSECALIIIDREGIIRYSHVSPQLHHIPDIYELLDQLKTLS